MTRARTSKLLSSLAQKMRVIGVYQPDARHARRRTVLQTAGDRGRTGSG